MSRTWGLLRDSASLWNTRKKSVSFAMLETEFYFSQIQLCLERGKPQQACVMVMYDLSSKMTNTMSALDYQELFRENIEVKMLKHGT